VPDRAKRNVDTLGDASRIKADLDKTENLRDCGRTMHALRRAKCGWRDLNPHGLAPTAT
jgi:hypothetical protein